MLTTPEKLNSSRRVYVTVANMCRDLNGNVTANEGVTVTNLGALAEDNKIPTVEEKIGRLKNNKAQFFKSSKGFRQFVAIFVATRGRMLLRI